MEHVADGAGLLASALAFAGDGRGPFTDTLRFRLRACGLSVPEARHRVRDQLRTWYRGDACDTAELVVTELVSNTVRHTQAVEVVCFLGCRGAELYLEVGEPGHADGDRPVPRAVGASEIHGRGLLLVDALCDEWWVWPSPQGWVVGAWFGSR